MIFIIGSRKDFNKIDDTFYTVWRGFVQKFNRLKQGEVDFEDELKVIEAALMKKSRITSSREAKKTIASTMILIRTLKGDVKFLKKPSDSEPRTFKDKKREMEGHITDFRNLISLTARHLKDETPIKAAA